MLQVWGIVKRDQSQEGWACCRCVVLYKEIRARRVGHVAGVGYCKKRSEPGGLGMLQVGGAACLKEA